MAIKSAFVIIHVLFCCAVIKIDGASSTCFTNFTKEIPANHVYNKIQKPAIIGYKGYMLKHQENTLEGMKAVIDDGYDGIHMQVQITYDEKLILFGDDHLKRLTGVDAAITFANYGDIKDMNIKTSVSYGNTTLTYSKTAKIPLLEDVLNHFKGKGKLIYIELKPSNAPPKDPADRYRSLRTGLLAGKLIRKLAMENEVFIVSADPFKLLSLNFENSAAISGWLIKKSFYEAKVAEQIRKEFVDLNGLRDCYIKTAPKGVDFLPFLLETGIATKSVNGSVFDADSVLINNPLYLSGQADTTHSLVKKNYNPRMRIGAFLSYYEGDDAVTTKEDERKRIMSLVNTGVDRIVTDDLAGVKKILRSVSGAAKTTGNAWALILSVLFSYMYL